MKKESLIDVRDGYEAKLEALRRAHAAAVKTHTKHGNGEPSPTVQRLQSDIALHTLLVGRLTDDIAELPQ